MILVTGGAGFIGSNFVLEWIRTERTPVVNLDRLTYAGNLQSLGGPPAPVGLNSAFSTEGERRSFGRTGEGV
jgi:nucleoside-diphosphate-sugar epimerase